MISRPPPTRHLLVVVLDSDGAAERAQAAAAATVAALLPYCSGREGSRYLRLGNGRKVWLRRLLNPDKRG
jgi:hypothetical protein